MPSGELLEEGLDARSVVGTPRAQSGELPCAVGLDSDGAEEGLVREVDGGNQQAQLELGTRHRLHGGHPVCQALDEVGRDRVPGMAARREYASRHDCRNVLDRGAELVRPDHALVLGEDVTVRVHHEEVRFDRDAVVEDGDQGSRHRLPLVEGTPPPSTRTASRSALPTP